ncbi:MAG: restriction endonuclease [Gaiellaceae bacterium]
MTTGATHPAWRELEARIGAYFTANGYDTQLNVIREGRSGGRHEMDVFAVKSDGITSFAVMVECKAWNTPIEKDIVSKAAYIVGDLGLNKAIIVSLAGWRTGADQAAKELGIDLWDATDLEQRLGQIAVAQLKGAVATPQRRVVGPLPLMSRDEGRGQLEKQRSGVFGKEELVLWQLVWAPFYLFEIRLTEAEKRLLGKNRLKSRTILNLYSALSGVFHLPHDPTAMPLGEIAAEQVIPARVRERAVAAELQKACKRLTELVSQNARKRQAAKIQALGIPLPFTSMSIDAMSEVAWPYYVGLLRRGEKERLVAVDAVRERVSDRMTTTLTEHHSYVLDALGGR